MAEAVLVREVGSSRQVGKCRYPFRIVAFCVKAAVVLFPIPTAFLTGAPPEIKAAAVYCTLVTLSLFLALAEIAGGVWRLADAVERSRGAS